MAQIKFTHGGIAGTYHEETGMVSFGGATFQLEAAINEMRNDIEQKIDLLKKSHLYIKYKSLQPDHVGHSNA